MAVEHGQLQDPTVVRHELLVAHGAASGFLQPPDAALDDVSRLVSLGVERQGLHTALRNQIRALRVDIGARSSPAPATA